MDASLVPQAAAGDNMHTTQPDQDTRLYGRRLVVARAVIFASVGLTLALYLLALPHLFQNSMIPCAPGHDADSCFFTTAQVPGLAKLGITPLDVALASVAFTVASILMVSVVAGILLFRRSDDWMALFLALMLILLPANYTGIMAGLPDGLAWLGVIASDASLATLYTLMAIFPTGRFVPRWVWLPLLVYVIVIITPLPSPDAPYGFVVFLASTLQVLVGLGFVVLLSISQIYRYRRMATPVQRQQIKWGVYGLVLTVIINQAFWQPFVWIPALNQSDSLYIMFVGVDSFLMIATLTIAFGVAILRYKLYDIDVLVNRALVYGSLTVILAAVYVVGVIGSQAIVGGLTHVSGQPQSPLSIVVTTLVIAALFQPLRHRLQTTIDRRFYRRKYDAERTLSAFASTLREEVDLRDLTGHLLGAVDETMQPSQVSLWLRRSGDRSHAAGTIETTLVNDG